MSKIIQTSFFCEFDNTVLTIYKNDDESILELVNGKVLNITLDNLDLDDLIELKDFIHKVILKKESHKLVKGVK